MADAVPPPPTPLSFSEALARLAGWVRREPVSALLLTSALLLLVYFFCIFKVFTHGSLTVARWAAESWNPENNQEHGYVIFPVAVLLVWYHRARLMKAEIKPANAGLWLVLGGLAFFIVSVLTLQPRLAIFALPLLLYGGVLFLWGREVAAVVLFPCVFLLFMIPIGNIVSGTVSLQILVSTVCNTLASLVGIKIEVAGTTINSLDGSFNFEIAEGCSGIRSLMAMTTLTALYVHFTQDKLWKQLVLFGASVVFAVVGNIARIFTVILVARFISPDLASGIYHDYSGYIFFPVAVVVMVGFGSLLNLSWTEAFGRWFQPEKASRPLSLDEDSKREGAPAKPISYDY